MFYVSDDIIFIHIPKNAGTSVFSTLVDVLGEPNFRKSSVGMSGHSDAESLREIVGKRAFNTAWKFAIVRNPWDRLISMYSHINELMNLDITFDTWLYSERDRTRKLDSRKQWPQTRYISSKSGKILVDDVFMFECLGELESVLSERLGKKITLKHIRRSNHKNYRKYYDKKSAKFVSKVFAEDIKKFGYSFLAPLSTPAF